MTINILNAWRYIPDTNKQRSKLQLVFLKIKIFTICMLIFAYSVLLFSYISEIWFSYYVSVAYYITLPHSPGIQCREKISAFLQWEFFQVGFTVSAVLPWCFSWSVSLTSCICWRWWGRGSLLLDHSVCCCLREMCSEVVNSQPDHKNGHHTGKPVWSSRMPAFWFIYFLIHIAAVTD